MTSEVGSRLIGVAFLVPLLGTLSAFAFVHWAKALRGIVVSVAVLQCAIAAALILALQNGSAPIVTQVGGWPVPLGIRLVADQAGVAALAIAGFVALATGLYTPVVDPTSARGRHDHVALIPPLLLGATGLALSADLFNLYVWFEVILASSFALLAYRGQAAQLRASLFYVSINLFASAFYLIAVAILYARFGTLDLAQLAQRASETDGRQTVEYAWGFLIVFFGIKVAAFPFFAWLPRAYPVATISVMALFSGLLTKFAFFALMRLWIALPPSEAFAKGLVWLGILTVFCGSAAAAVERRSRRFVAWLLAGEMGFLLLALAYGSVDGLAATLFLLIHMSLAVTTLLLSIGLIESCGYSLRLDEEGRGGGLFRKAPGALGAFGVASLALVGAPPFSGFVGKLALLRVAFDRESWIGGSVVQLSSLVSLALLGGFWLKAAAKGDEEDATESAREGVTFGRAVSVALLLAGQLLIVIKAAWIYGYCEHAATTLLTWPNFQFKGGGG